MSKLSDIPDDKICKGVIIDSLIKDNFITQAQAPPQEDVTGRAKNFFNEHKTAILTGGFAVAGLFAGPAILGGVIGAIGFGEAGIAAGSMAAWMMSLHRGAVAAGSLVAILQSVGAAGLGVGGVIAAGLGGSLFAGAIAKVLSKYLENDELLAELEKFVSITVTNESNSVVTFDMKYQLLINEEALKSFCKGFDSARRITKTKNFKFLIISNDEKCIEGSNSLRKYLEDTYGVDHVSENDECYFLNLNDV